MHFVYPRDPLQPRLPDELFRAEAQAFQAAGHSVSLIDTDALAGGPARIGPPIEAGAMAAYRGWMLTPPEYQALVDSLAGQGALPLTTREQYLSAHYLPHWYPLLADLTPETVVLDPDGDLERALRELGWPRFFVKDYVKSLKTSVGSVVERPEDIGTVVAEMRRYRGTIEGGLCVRRFEPFAPDTERRFFVLDGVVHGADPDLPVPEIARECAGRLGSPFFSVDVAQTAGGTDRIVEVGDGQVSDLVGWSPERFVAIWPG